MTEVPLPAEPRPGREPVRFEALPRRAAWRHMGRRTGVEVVFLSGSDAGWELRGTSTGLADGTACSVAYVVTTDRAWRTRSARVHVRAEAGDATCLVERGADDRRTVDGAARPDLDGCQDVSLAVAVAPLLLPVRRRDLDAAYLAPAALVDVDLAVTRHERRCGPLVRRSADGSLGLTYRWPDGSDLHGGVADGGSGDPWSDEVVLDPAGLALEWPGRATRLA